jgi:hypothetical protein
MFSIFGQAMPVRRIGPGIRVCQKSAGAGASGAEAALAELIGADGAQEVDLA